MLRSLLLIVLLGNLSLLQAQDTGTIKGIISDKTTGKVVPNSLVQIIGVNSFTSSVQSDSSGRYMFRYLKPGAYTVNASGSNYKFASKKDVLVKAGSAQLVNFALESQSTNIPPPVSTEIVDFPDVEMSVESQIQLSSDSRMLKRYYANGSTIRPDRAMNTESYNKIDDNTYKSVTVDPLSTFSIDVDRAAYSNVRRFLTDGTMPPKDAVRIEEMINYFSYDYPAPTGEDPFSITTEYSDCPWNKDHKIVHIGIKGEEILKEIIPANNLVFLIDVSGSMNSSNKLGLLKKGLYLLVDQMRDEDRVAIVAYAGNAGLILPSTAGNKKDEIIKAIENLSAGGSTAGGAGIKLAYKIAKENYNAEGNNRIILATDGDFNVGISSDGDLIRLIEEKRNDNIFLSVLGFGSGNLKDSKMEQIADKGNGNYSYIDNVLEAKKVLVNEFGGTLVVIAKDVKVQAEFNPTLVKGYRLIGYVNRMLNNEDFNDDKKDAGELGSGHSVTVLYEIIPAGSDEEILSIDSLKYQNQIDPNLSPKHKNEVLTVKFRYKEPKEDSSKLITHVLTDENTPFNQTSNDLQFAAAVASFGMVLRDSEFKGESGYQNVLKMARSAKGEDQEGYRAEFIRLVELAELLQEK